MYQKKLIPLIAVGLILLFFVLFARLAELQIIKGGYYKSLADGNRIRKVVLIAPRGEVIARGGEHIIKNTPHDSYVYYDGENGYFLSKSEGDGKLLAVTQWDRVYPLKNSAGHITGYLGSVSSEEVQKIDAACVEKGTRSGSDNIGRSGIEEYYDCRLRGINGEVLLEIEADGSFIRELGIKDPVKGEDLRSTIDYALQEQMPSFFEGQKGAVIVSDTEGEILAFYSSPGYDPNIFIEGGKNVELVLSDTNLPLYNRAVSGKYAPGSIYKPIVAISALEDGSIDENYRYQDTGKISFSTAYGSYSFSNWYFTQYGGVEGNIDLTRAIARSTDTFFYKLGELTGIENIVKWSKDFGLSQVSGIDIKGEAEGLVPDPLWKEKVKGERWYLGNTYHMSIGQGDLLVTPIGIHRAIASIAAGGKICTPHIVTGSQGSGSELCRDMSIDSKNIELVKEGMRKACSSGGTGYTFFDFREKYGIDVACKTGTAQIGTGDDTHAWFTAFAPVAEPEIVVTVLVEKGGEGSKVAGPIARSIFDFWYKD